MRHLVISIGSDRYRCELLEGSPATGEWLMDRLPSTARLVHAMWSGPACVMPLEGDPPKLESAITSIYPGYLLVSPAGVEGMAGAALLLSYGPAELRDEQGRRFGSPVARVLGPLDRFRAALAAARTAGAVDAAFSVEGDER